LHCLSDYRYQYDKATFEAQLLKEFVDTHRWPTWMRPFGKADVPHVCNTIDDQQLRHHFHDRQRTIVHDYAIGMSTLVLEIYKAKYDESRQAFDREMARLWQEQRALPEHERWSSAVFDLFDRRFTLITDRLRSAFVYKRQAP
jgi:hypothetical protein